jgi:molybdopterin molybdotransferase
MKDREMPELIPVKEAVNRMLDQFLAVPEIIVPLEQAAGMVLSQDITAEIDLPPFTNSGMDGFAVIAQDTAAASEKQPVTLKVIIDIPAGFVPDQAIQPGQSARIMTGAMVPRGANAIIPIEDTNHALAIVDAPLPETVLIRRPAQNGAYLRPQGQDLHRGELVLKKGRRLTPQDIGMLAALGFSTVPVFRKPRIALLSSGDELVSPTESLRPGKIRDSNTYTLGALCEQNGAEVVRLGTVADNPELIRERLEIAIDRSVDLILTSAGVSVGAFDYMRSVIEQNGSLSFWRVNMRPGKPVAFGSYHGIPLIGLPGNPVSAFVGFHVLVVPVLNRLCGLPHLLRRKTTVTLDEPIESDGRESYLRVTLSEKCGKITATLAGHQGSGNLFSLVKAHAFIIIPAGVTSLQAGSEVEAWILDDSWSTHEKA